MHKSAMKCSETVGKWCKNKHGASKIVDTFETYHACCLYSINCPTVICLPSMCYLSYGETPLVNCGRRSYFLYIAITYLLYSHYILYSHTIITFHSIRSYPLFQANWWDWQPHRKLGTKYLVVLWAGSMLLLAEDALTRFIVKWCPCWSVTRLSCITFSRLFAPLQINIPWFLK
jgi:hypothetical protein